MPSELPEEDMMGEVVEEAEESLAVDESSSFIIEEELPETDPSEYGPLFDEEPEMAEQFPGESEGFDEPVDSELPMEEAEEPFMEEEFVDEEMAEQEFMEDEAFEDDSMVEELPEESLEETVEQPAESMDTVADESTSLLHTVTQYVTPIVDFVKQNVKLVGAGIGGLLVLLLGFLGLKKFRGGEEVLELDDDDDILDFDDADSGSATTEQSGTEETLVMDAPIDLESTGTGTETDIERTAANDFSDSQPPGFAEPQTDDDEEDPLAEVNVFLAYEHFDQAEEFVKNALAKEPDNLEFHTKLLEVYYAAGDKKSYEEAAKTVRDKFSDSGEHWDNIMAMWSEMSPNREIFSERMDGLDDTQALAPGAAEEALSSGIVDLTANEPATDATESDIVETSADVLDITGQNIISEEQPELSGEQDLIGTLSEGNSYETLSEDNILDVSTNGTEDSHSLDLTGADQANVLESSLPTESTEHILDLTGGESEEDILDITAGSQEDLLDVTASTDLDSLPSMTARKSDIEEESTLDFDVQALDLDMPESESNTLDSHEPSGASMIERAMDTIDATEITAKPDDSAAEDMSDSTVIDFDLQEGDGEAPSLDLDISGSFDLSEKSESDTSVDDVTIQMDESEKPDEVEMTVELPPESVPTDSEPSLEVDLSDEVTLDIDTPGETTDDLKNGLDESTDQGGVEMDLTNEFTLDEENTDSLSEGFDLELQDDDEEMIPNTELDIDMEGTVEMPKGTASATTEMPTVEMPKIDYVDDEDDKTVFVPRSSGAEEQSLEDEVSTKLDLAKAYVELGDNDSAKTILDEIVAEGNDEQKQIAEQLLSQVT